jgi:hypothetical protein
MLTTIITKQPTGALPPHSDAGWWGCAGPFVQLVTAREPENSFLASFGLLAVGVAQA